ncbi:hypothetical protein AB1Y20_006791 [Prymnesium parvum]|uniref:L-type lectin-like domain-containing protein n=1 Tax=Prymnesium parvum TaxID=97485 RepID=A0AB34J1P1_PRYPA
MLSRKVLSTEPESDVRAMPARQLHLAACCLAALVAAQESKYLEALSFAAPFNEINTFSGLRHVPGWEVGGSAEVHRSFVRLTAERQGQKGWMVSHTPLKASQWSAMLEIRASGMSPHLYGDGLAIWVVENPDHIEGDVFGREDHWKGLGIFFDTFQNLDHSHHHKHPYIYAMMNDGSKRYIPDAEKPDTSKQALPGAVENSGCSYDFRYAETREDVSVLNHTRVHVIYQNKALKLRLQQTSVGLNKEWYSCFDMKDVDIPPTAFLGVSSATGDLVDNHDVIQFNVRSLEGVANAEADYDAWAAAEQQAIQSKLEEHDLRPAEALQRDYQRVLRAQASAIKLLSQDVEALKQQLEFQLASMNAGLSSTKQRLDSKGEEIKSITQLASKLQENMGGGTDLKAQAALVNDLKKQVAENMNGGGWRLPFFLLFCMLVALAGVGYNRYRKITKSHFL